MNSLNGFNMSTVFYSCCQCKTCNKSVIAPGHPTQCKSCSHFRCHNCGFPESGEQSQSLVRDLRDSIDTPASFNNAQTSHNPQPLQGFPMASKTSMEPKLKYYGKGGSMSASPSFLELNTSFSNQDAIRNIMRPPPSPASLTRGLALRSYSGNLSGIPKHPTLRTAYCSLPPTPPDDISKSLRAWKRPGPLQMPCVAQLRGPSSPTEGTQTPPTSGTSAYFSEGAMSGSPFISDVEIFDSEYSTANLMGDDSLIPNEPLPVTARSPSPRSSRPRESGPRRPAILSEKSPQRPVHRKPKAPLPPRIVKPNDPKDFKTAQNTIAARGTRQRKVESATWLQRYRDDTKSYITDLEEFVTERNERIAELERENMELKRMFELRPESTNLSKYIPYSSSSSSKQQPTNDSREAGPSTATPQSQDAVESKQALCHGLGINDLIRYNSFPFSEPSHQQSLNDSSIAGFSSASLPEMRGFFPKGTPSHGPSANERPLFGPSPHSTASHESSFSDHTVAGPSSGMPGQQEGMVGVSEDLQFAMEMGDDGFVNDKWQPDTDHSADPDFGIHYWIWNSIERGVALAACSAFMLYISLHFGTTRSWLYF